MYIIIFILAIPIPLISCAQSLQVKSNHIHHGANKVEKGSFRDFIPKSKADIVGLQLVDGVFNPSGKLDQMKIFGHITKMQPLFSRHSAFDGGAYGLGILSKFPLVLVRNERILGFQFNDGVLICFPIVRRWNC